MTLLTLELVLGGWNERSTHDIDGIRRKRAFDDPRRRGACLRQPIGSLDALPTSDTGHPAAPSWSAHALSVSVWPRPAARRPGGSSGTARRPGSSRRGPRGARPSPTIAR